MSTLIPSCSAEAAGSTVQFPAAEARRCAAVSPGKVLAGLMPMRTSRLAGAQAPPPRSPTGIASGWRTPDQATEDVVARPTGLATPPRSASADRLGLGRPCVRSTARQALVLAGHAAARWRWLHSLDWPRRRDRLRQPQVLPGSGQRPDVAAAHGEHLRAAGNLRPGPPCARAEPRRRSAMISLGDACVDQFQRCQCTSVAMLFRMRRRREVERHRPPRATVGRPGRSHQRRTDQDGRRASYLLDRILPALSNELSPLMFCTRPRNPGDRRGRAAIRHARTGRAMAVER